MLRLLRLLAFPISLIYGLVVHIRNFLFDVGVFSSVSFDTPLICVGNLSVGGTGKTPMIEYLIRLLSTHEVAILSRGYRRSSKGFILAGPNHDAQDLGDEPFQIHRKFPKTTVAVDADRRNGITQLERLTNPSVILLDDAFQHRKVNPHFSILLTAYDSLYVNDWYLPTGNLRDSKREARRADLIVVTKCPQNLGKERKQQIIKGLNPKKHQEVLFSYLEYADYVKSEDTQLDLDDIEEKDIALVTGIANPAPLLQFLKSKRINFTHFAFGDHHAFSDKEIAKFKNFEMVLTTEKDFVRLMGKTAPLFYLEVAHTFNAEDASILENRIKSIL